MSTTSSKTSQILRDVRRGAYRDQYLIYNRKSTDEPNNQKNSLKYQREENVKFASKAGLSIASLSIEGFCTDGIIAERHSGFKENNDIAVSNSGMVQYQIARPKFKQLMQVLSKGHFKGVICLCWDRMSRNKADDTIITKLMRSGVDVRFAYAQYDNTSAGALHMDIDGMFAAHHSRVTSEKVKLANRNMRERGICIYRAPIGYLNIGKSTDKPFDPERAPLIRQMFERYAEGNMSISDITRWANEQGLTTQPMRRRRTAEEILAEDENEPISPQICRPVTRTMVHRILTNPFYIGYLVGYDGAQVKSVSHKPLVGKKLFYTVQEQLEGKRTSIHYDQKIDLPFRGMVRCDQCGHAYTPYRQKGHVYLGVRCVAGCPNVTKNCSLSSIEKQIETLLKGLCLSEAEQEELDARASTDIALLENKHHLQLEQMERKKRKVREDLKYLRENKLTLLKTGAFNAQGLVSEEIRLNASLIKLQDKEQTSDTSMAEMMKDIARLSELLKDARYCYISANSSEKELFVRLIFSELSLSQNTLKFRCKNGFKALESRLVTVGCPTEWLSELDRLDGIKESIVELEKLLKKA